MPLTSGSSTSSSTTSGMVSAQRVERARAGFGVDQLDVERLQHLVIEAQDRWRVLDQQQTRFCRHALSMRGTDINLVWFQMTEHPRQHHYKAVGACRTIAANRRKLA